MATVDTSIYGNLLRPAKSVADFENDYARADANKLQALMGRAKLDEYGRGVAKQNRLAALLGGGSQGEQLESELMRGGFLAESQGLQKSRLDGAKTKADITKTQADAQKAEFQTAADRLKLISDAAASARDPASYAQVRQSLASQGIDVSSIPEQFDPVYVQNAGRQALTELQRVQAAAEERGFTLDLRKQAEVERGNRASEGLRGAELSVSRQRLALDQNAPRGQIIETEQGFMLADPRGGTARPLTGESGQPLKGKAANRQLTEGQAKANMFGSRMVESDRLLEGLAAEGVTRPSLVKRAAEAVPLIGTGLGMAANATVVSDKQQQVEQAQRDFINAILRRESGAVISPQEFDNAQKQYFAQPGDSQAVLAQKKANRQTAIQGMLAEVPDSFRVKPVAPAAPAGGSSIDSLLDKYK